MSKSIDNLLKQLLDSQEAQTKALDEKFAAFASEGNTYTERMRKMEESLAEAMKKVLEMDSNIKEYHKNTGAKVDAMEAQYAKMFDKSEQHKEDEKNHEKNEPESIKKQEEEMEDDEKKKKKQKKKDKEEHIKEDEQELKDEKKIMAKSECEPEDKEEEEKKASKMPSDKKLIVDGPVAEEAEASNQINGVYKNQVVGAPQNQKRHKENPLGKPKNAEETLPEAQATEELPEAVASEQTPASVPAAVEAVVDSGLDSKIEEIVKKFASLTAAKPVAMQEELDTTKSAMALEIKAKEEAISKYKALEEKFESLLNKVNHIEKSAKTVEQKAAQIVASQGTEAVAISTEAEVAPVAETDADIYKKFSTLSGVEQRKYYLANKSAIESHASALLSGKRS